MQNLHIVTKEEKTFIIKNKKFIEDSKLLSFLLKNQDNKNRIVLEINFSILENLIFFYQKELLLNEENWNFEFKKLNNEKKLILFNNSKYLNLEIFINRFFNFLKNDILENEIMKNEITISEETKIEFEKSYGDLFKENLKKLINYRF